MFKEKNWYSFGIGVAAMFATIFVSSRVEEMTACLLFALSNLILLSLRLLIGYLKPPRALPILATLSVCLPVLFFAPSAALPLFAITIAQLTESIARLGSRIAVCAVTCLLIALIAGTSLRVCLLALLFLAVALAVSFLVNRQQRLFDTLTTRSMEIEDLRERLMSQRRMAQSMEHTARLMERNRLAARIHDEIGHGMSGSILLLEGAEAIMEKDPKEAEATVRRVADNLRDSVDKIRAVLREERSEMGETNLTRIRNELTKFEADHQGIHTRLDAVGDMNGVPGAIWICVYENMLEAMINMLKHSGGDFFRVVLTNRNRLFTVDMTDNGMRPTEEAEKDLLADVGKGIGLLNIEERCALCYGRCFFHRRPDGFAITMNFPLREG